MSSCEAHASLTRNDVFVRVIADDVSPKPLLTRNNLLYLVIGGLVVVVAVLGYQLYQDRKEPKGIQLNIGPSGVSIEKK